jgi:serine/threonine protein kinase
MERLGHGGSGTIYRGEHVTLRRKVAVKVLHHELSRDDMAVERFRREATTVGELDNDHIVEIYDFGRTPDGRLYLAMEYLEGETLEAVLSRDGKLGVDLAVSILIQLGEALMEAHAIGYVHRDLRPRNIYLTHRRRQKDYVKLLDFGLAKLVKQDGDAASTSLGMTFGDPKYMSPEQARGDSIDRRADIYSLGCIAYQMLVGTPPFASGKAFEILTGHVTRGIESPRSQRPDVPEWLSRAVVRMLAKNPAERFATVYRLVEALRSGRDTGEVMDEESATRIETVPPPSISQAMKKISPEAEPYQQSEETMIGVSPAPAAAVAAPSAPAGSTGSERVTIPASAVPAPAPADRSGPAAAAVPEAQARRASDAFRGGAAQPVDNFPTEKVDTDPAPVPVVHEQTGPSDGIPKEATPASGKSKSAAAISSAGISAAWYAHGEAQAGGDDLGAQTHDKLRKARHNDWADTTSADDVYFDEPTRGRMRWFVIGGALVLVAFIGTLLAWPGGKEEQAEAADTADAAVLAARTPIDAGANPAVPRDAAVAAAPADAAAAVPAKTTESPAGDKGTAKDGRTSTRNRNNDRGSDRRTPPPPPPPPPPPTDPAPLDPYAGGTGESSDEDKEQAKFFVKMGRKAIADRNYPEAAKHFRKAKQFHPGNSGATAGMGELALLQGNHAVAIKHLSKAGRSARIRTLLGEAYLGAGKKSKAAEAFKAALKMNADNERARKGYNKAMGLTP